MAGPFLRWFDVSLILVRCGADPWHEAMVHLSTGAYLWALVRDYGSKSSRMPCVCRTYVLWQSMSQFANIPAFDWMRLVYVALTCVGRAIVLALPMLTTVIACRYPTLAEDSR